jgi:hypothetical protein
MRKTVSRLVALSLAATATILPIQAASGATFSAEGVELTWSVPYLPAKYACKDITINYANKGSIYYDRVWLSIVDKYGDRVGENFAPYVEPGDSGVIRIQICNGRMKPKGYELVLETTTGDYKVAVNTSKFKFKKR